MIGANREPGTRGAGPGPARQHGARRSHHAGCGALAGEMIEQSLPSGRPLPLPIYAVADQALAQLRTPGAAQTEGRSRVPTRSGRWLLLHASRLRGTPAVAVIIEEALSLEMASVIAAAYGLTQRERQVAERVLHGRSTKEIAAALHLSTHTVNDHLKVIFEKVGASSRGELSARVFVDHYSPRVMRGEHPGPSGWFAGAGDRTSSRRLA